MAIPRAAISTPESGATTHPGVLSGCIEYLQQAGFADISVLESSWVGDKTERAMQVCGYGKVCERYGCRAAYNFDGGHSTSLVFMGQELSLLTLADTPHGNIRGLSDIVIFLQNDAVQPKESDLQ